VLLLGFAVVAILLVVGTVAVTSVELSRMRLLDAADSAALDAADALDDAAYRRGLAAGVDLSDASVRKAAADYLAHDPRPDTVRSWALAPGTGTPDGHTAVVRLTAVVDVPLVGAALRTLGGPLIITVESRARAQLG
jgi:hypothetical protein